MSAASAGLKTHSVYLHGHVLYKPDGSLSTLTTRGRSGIRTNGTVASRQTKRLHKDRLASCYVYTSLSYEVLVDHGPFVHGGHSLLWVSAWFLVFCVKWAFFTPQYCMYLTHVQAAVIYALVGGLVSLSSVVFMNTEHMRWCLHANQLYYLDPLIYLSWCPLLFFCFLFFYVWTSFQKTSI